MKKPQLVDGWTRFWTWYSTWALTALAAIQLGWQTIPPEVLAALPESAKTWAIGIVWVLGIVGRVVQQTPRAE